MPKTLDELVCECCGRDDDPVIGVAALPGIAMSIAWGQRCHASGAIPYWAAVANTAAINGLHNADDWWLEVVDATLKYFDLTYRKFEADVEKSLEEERRYFEKMEREDRERSGDSIAAGEDRPEAPRAL